MILAEDGLLWNRRIQMDTPLGRKYGWSPEAGAEAEGKLVASSNTHIAAHTSAPNSPMHRSTTVAIVFPC